MNRFEIQPKRQHFRIHILAPKNKSKNPEITVEII